MTSDWRVSPLEESYLPVRKNVEFSAYAVAVQRQYSLGSEILRLLLHQAPRPCSSRDSHRWIRKSSYCVFFGLSWSSGGGEGGAVSVGRGRCRGGRWHGCRVAGGCGRGEDHFGGRRPDAPMGKTSRIAQRFSAGMDGTKRTKSRQGRQNGSSVPAGLGPWQGAWFPALKRWAILGNTQPPVRPAGKLETNRKARPFGVALAPP
jgi:hypothetical protein